MFPHALMSATVRAGAFWSAAMNSTLRTARAAWSAVLCRRASHFACVSLLLLSACDGEGFALTEVDGGFVLGADTSGSGDGSASTVESTCSTGPGGSACPAELPRCLPSAAGGCGCIAAGPVEPGAVCAAEGVDDCVVNAICVKSDDVEGWRCRQLCDPSRRCLTGVCAPLGPRGVNACLPLP
jgi:hypothetical protein